MNGPDGEAIAWIKILENVVVIADVSKLQRSTNGEWFAIICRSLVCILRMSGGEYTNHKSILLGPSHFAYQVMTLVFSVNSQCWF